MSNGVNGRNAHARQTSIEHSADLSRANKKNPQAIASQGLFHSVAENEPIYVVDIRRDKNDDATRFVVL